MTSQQQTDIPALADGPIHCISCNITFSTQAHLDAHLPCSNVNFDLSRVKTEDQDSQQTGSDLVPMLTQNSSHLLASISVKEEIKVERSDSKGSTLDDNVSKDLTFVSQQQNQVPKVKLTPVKRTRRRGVGRKQQTQVISGGTSQKPSAQEILPRTRPRGDSLGVKSHVQSTAMKKYSPLILPKQSVKPNEAGIKINGVYYTKPEQNRESSTKSGQQPSIISVPVSSVVSTQSAQPTSLSASNSLPVNSVNAQKTLPFLPSQSIINHLPFGSTVMFGNNILSPAQQGPILLGNATPLFNPIQTMNPLQPSALIPGLQNLNVNAPQSLQNVPAFQLPVNQNIVPQNTFQVVSSALPTATVATVSASKPVSPASSTAVLASNPAPLKVPVLVGNQIILMDLQSSSSVQTGLMQGNSVQSVGLSVSQSFPQLLQTSGQFSSGSTFSVTTQPTAVVSSQPSISQHYPIPTTMAVSVPSQSNTIKDSAPGVASNAVTSNSKPLLPVTSSTTNISSDPKVSLASTRVFRKSRGRWRGRAANIRVAQNLMKKRLLGHGALSKSRFSNNNELTNLLHKVALPNICASTTETDSTSTLSTEKQNPHIQSQNAKKANLENTISNLKSTALKMGVASQAENSSVLAADTSLTFSMGKAVISTVKTATVPLVTVSTSSPGILSATSVDTSVPSHIATSTVLAVKTSTVPAAITSELVKTSKPTGSTSEFIKTSTVPTASTSEFVKTSTTAAREVQSTIPVTTVTVFSDRISPKSSAAVSAKRKGKASPAGQVRIAPAPPKTAVSVPFIIACSASSVKAPSAPQPAVALSPNKFVVSPSGQLVSPTSLISSSSVAPVIQQPSLLFPQIQQSQQVPIPYLNNFFNLGSPQVPLYSNTLSMPTSNFVMDRNTGQNVWIQNITNNQPIVIGNTTNQQPLILGSPIRPTVATTHNTHAITPLNSGNAQSALDNNKISTDTYLAQGQGDIAETPKIQDNSIKLKSEDTHNQFFNEGKGPKSRNVTEGGGVEEIFVKEGSAQKRKDENIPRSTWSRKQRKTEESGKCPEDKESSSHSRRNLSPSNVKTLQGKNDDPSVSENDMSKTMKDKPLLTEYFDPKTGLLLKQRVPQNEPAEETDNSHTDTAGLDTFFKNEKTDSASDKGCMFLGPLSKKELEDIVKNPSELGKYVPSGHVLATSKALAVPNSFSSAANVVLTSGSKAIQQEMPSYSGAMICSITGNYNPGAECSADSTNTRIVFPPIFPKPPAQNNETKALEKKRQRVDSDVSKANVLHVEEEVNNDLQGRVQAHRRLGTSPKKKFMSEKRKLEKKQHESDLMKLSFVGDIGLLKDALRKTTVNLEKLFVDDNELLAAMSDYNSQQKHLEELSEPKYPNTKAKHVGSRTQKEDVNKIATDDVDREREEGKGLQKQWVPLEVVGDLTIRGRLLNGGEEDLDAQGKRRSTRISAMPKLDYADLERRPFRDLEEDSDSNFDSDPGDFEIITDLEQDMPLTEEQLYCDNQHLLENPNENVKTQDNVLTSDVTRSEMSRSDLTTSPSLGADKVHNTSKLQKEVQATSLPASNAVDEKRNSLEHTTSERSLPEPMELKMGAVTEDRDESQPEDIPDNDNGNECYYSSESESDVCDPNMEFGSKAEKKKYIFKCHSEVTMFLIKHAGKFHSVDDKDEHYCDVCKSYKTNGIFSLAKHLKTHL